MIYLPFNILQKKLGKDQTFVFAKEGMMKPTRFFSIIFLAMIALYALVPGSTVAASSDHRALGQNPSSTLQVIVMADSVTVRANDSIGLTITVTNTSQTPAYGVKLQDQLSSEVSWSSNRQECTISSSGLLSCDFGSLAAWASVSVHVSATSNLQTTTTLTNTAEAWSVGTSKISSNAANVTILCDADMAILKTASAPQVNAGQTISFTIKIKSISPYAANTVIMSDDLPVVPGVTWSIQAPVPSACEIASGELTCKYDTLASGESRSVTITSPTDESSCGVITNTATVYAYNEPWMYNDNNTSTARIEVLCPSPALSVTKTADASPVDAGDPVGFSITVNNTGTGTARSVTLEDQLPATLTWSETTNANCTINSSQLLTCSLGDLVTGAFKTVHVTAKSSEKTCGDITNWAYAKASNNTKVKSNEAKITINCPKPSEVRVIKTAADSSVTAGQAVTFTIRVENTSTVTAKYAKLTDQLPVVTGMTWTIVDPTSVPACKIAAGALACDYGDLPGGDYRSVTITSPTTTNSCGTVPNTAVITADNDIDPSNNQSSASVTVTCPLPGLTVTKTADASPVNAGDPVGFSIVVKNNGAGTAKAVVLEDQLPATLVWNQTTSADCTISSGQMLTCNIGDLAVGASVTVHIGATSSEQVCGDITNTAYAKASNSAQVKSNEATITIVCPQVADVKVTKTAASASVTSGEPVSFTILVENISTATAKYVKLTDRLPIVPGMTWSIVDPESVPVCQIASGSLLCDFGDLPAGDSRTVTVTSPTTAESCGDVPNTAIVSADNDSDPSNNESTASTTVTCPLLPGLIITKQADICEVNGGDVIGFMITVSNNGTVPATNLVIRDPLPASFSWNWTVDPADVNCSIDASQVLTCHKATLAVGSSVNLHVTAQSTTQTCGEYVNVASAWADNYGPEQSRDASIIIDCPQYADVQVSKSAENAYVDAGSTVRFMMRVDNLNASIAKDVVLTDTLPVVTGISWSIAGQVPGCSIDGGVLTCNFGDLAGKATKFVNIISPTTADSCGTINNTAKVASTNDIYNPANNTSSAKVVIGGDCSTGPNLVLTKTADTTSVIAENSIGFTITVTNNGLVAADNVVIEDQLAAGLVWSETTGATTCTIDQSTNLLTCNQGTLEAGASVTYHVTAVVPLASCGTTNYDITNTAIAMWNDTRQSSSLAAQVTVVCPVSKVDVSVTKTTPSASVSEPDPVIFTMMVTNTAPVVAPNVVLTDILPVVKGMTWSIVTPAPTECKITGETLTCSFGDLTVGASRSVSITSATTEDSCSTEGFSNTATVSATNEPTENLKDNSATATVNVVCTKPKLTLSKVADASSVSVPNTLGYTITLGNAGLEQITNAIMEDNLNTALKWTATVIPASAGNCSIDPANQHLACTFPSILSGDSNKVSVHVTAPTSQDVCATIYNTAVAEAENYGQVQSDTVPVTITNCTPLVNVKVTETVNATSIYPDPATPIIFTMVVGSDGQATAEGVVLSDTLPDLPGLTWSIVNPVTGCSVANKILTCTFSSLAPGESRTVSISSPTDKVPLSFVVTNTVTVSATNESVGNQADNTATAQVTIPFADCINLNVFGGKYFNNFNGDFPAQIGVSNYQLSVAPAGQKFLGEFSNQTITLNISCLPTTHDEVVVSFDLYLIRSWDGNNTDHGPDRFMVDVDGGPILLDTTFSNWDRPDYMQSYPNSYMQGDFAGTTDAVASNTLGYKFYSRYQDSIYHLTFKFPHTGDTITLHLTASGLQSIEDESWGIDNLSLVPTGPYEFFIPIIAIDTLDEVPLSSPMEVISEYRSRQLEPR
jgi:uncharacterized repeat protein (TIGR01451 family)